MGDYCKDGLDPISGCKVGSTDCLNCCNKNCRNNCLKSVGGYLNDDASGCDNYCKIECDSSNNSSGGSSSGSDIINKCLTLSDSNSGYDCASTIINCCKKNKNCDSTCINDCNTKASNHCIPINTDPSRPDPSRPDDDHPKKDVTESKSFFDTTGGKVTIGIGSVVLITLIILAIIVAMKKK